MLHSGIEGRWFIEEFPIRSTRTANEHPSELRIAVTPLFDKIDESRSFRAG
jgi:hypothetical protein